MRLALNCVFACLWLAGGCGSGAATAPHGGKHDASVEDDGDVPPDFTGQGERLRCDGESTLALDESDAERAALAMGLCPQSADQTFAGAASGAPWGLVSARFTSPDGTAEMKDVAHGVLSSFGVNVSPLDGERLLVLSSGTARAPGDPDYNSPAGTIHLLSGTAPEGFPIEFPACEVDAGADKSTYDGAALEVTLRAPDGAKGIRFNVNFYTFEFPEYVCSQYNDFFVVLQDPAPESAQLGNIAFDTMGNPISVNNAFVEVCKPQESEGKAFPCRLGPSQLSGTGFESHAATGWLEVAAPVASGSQFTLRFAVWDAGDSVLDSTVLIDNFRFDTEDVGEPAIVPIL